MEMINLQLQIFLLLAIGYWLGKSGFLSKKTTNQLSALVINLILPASIVRSFQIEMTAEILESTLFVLILSTVIQILTIFVSKFIWKQVKNPEKRLNLEYGTIANNAGTLGMVVAEAAFGEVGLLYSSIYMIPVRIMMWTAGIALYSHKKQTEQSRLKGLGKVLLHPCIIAIYIGIVLMLGSMAGFELPGFLQKTLNSLANCNTAMVMLVIGTILSEISPKDIADKLAGIYSIFRLLVFPAAVFIILKLLPIPALASNICIIETAMPASVTMPMLAQKYGKDPQFASKMILISTLLSLFTMPVWTWLFSLPQFS